MGISESNKSDFLRYDKEILEKNVRILGRFTG
jgi:hypothetical protein